MRTFNLPASTREYLLAPASLSSGSIQTTQVEMALMPYGDDPDESDWQSATWELQPDTTYAAKCMLGVDLPLVPGKMQAYLRVTAGEERPVRIFAVINVV